MMNRMVKMNELCLRLVEDTGVSLGTVKFVSRKLFEYIKETLKEQTPVEVPDFGRFDFRTRKARVSKNLYGGKDTFTPENATLHFTPDVHWASWQCMHSMKLPEKIPEGTKLGERLLKSSYVRQQLGDAAPPMSELVDENELSFYENVIVARKTRKQQQQEDTQNGEK